jgi:hypothetical protein
MGVGRPRPLFDHSSPHVTTPFLTQPLRSSGYHSDDHSPAYSLQPHTTPTTPPSSQSDFGFPGNWSEARICFRNLFKHGLAPPLLLLQPRTTPIPPRTVQPIRFRIFRKLVRGSDLFSKPFQTWACAAPASLLQPRTVQPIRFRIFRKLVRTSDLFSKISQIDITDR